eukprot:TRINITY_DN15185_c0_g1_i1.p1 TRINITY_DN15185_c0_g1~~TRINITY_DN15185_c0_g1_i1.p1  ORF type:complete len:299 (+),score=127.27 TRINITY_DN15185_c0_g1_i1:97-897(+)
MAGDAAVALAAITKLGHPDEFVSRDYQPSVWEPVTGAAAYLLAVYLLKQREGKPLGLQAVAVVHNCILIAISLVTTIGGILALQQRYEQEGVDGIFCSQRPAGTVLDGAAGWWLRIFYWTKFYELGDTMLLCLKKKETIPLHLYHHVVMLLLCWSWVRFGWLEGSLWCVIVNSIIHTFMYTYYLLAALGRRVWWKKYLTSGQIFQFCTGTLYVTVYLWSDYTRGCGSAERRYCAYAAHSVNLTFIVLFSQFFKKSYGEKRCAVKAD